MIQAENIHSWVSKSVKVLEKKVKQIFKAYFNELTEMNLRKKHYFSFTLRMHWIIQNTVITKEENLPYYSSIFYVVLYSKECNKWRAEFLCPLEQRQKMS